MMKTIPIYLKDQSYNVIASRGLFKEEAASMIREFSAPNERVAIVSDENVWRLYGAPLLAELEEGGAGCFPVVIIPGEDTKTMQTLEWIFETFAREGLDAGGLVVALGGGMVGDIAGFSAACWKRGVRYIQIPTSLVSMVDSSIGGKTGVDIPAGKNLVGSFHHPSLVIVDPDLLHTLPNGEFAVGMAEVIKYGASQSKVLFNNLEATNYNVWTPALMDIITDCVRIKAKTVAVGDLDTGRRAPLAFGSIFARAIDSKYGSLKFPRGIASAAGMALAALYGEAAGITVPGTAERLQLILQAYGLGAFAPADGLYEFIISGKQADDMIQLVLLKEIGKAESFDTPLSEIEEQLAEIVYPEDQL